MHPPLLLLLFTLRDSPARTDLGPLPAIAPATQSFLTPLCDEGDGSDGDDCSGDESDEPLI